jgi:GTP-binding protein YchF
MDIGLIGLPQSGKKTLFELLVGSDAPGKKQDPIKSRRGIAEVQDDRFDKLLSIYSPKKHTRARIEFLLLPKIEGHNISESDTFDELADVDALCHVVRVFENDAVYHVSGSVNPQRDIDFVNSELILHDLLFIEKRIQRIDNKLKKIKDETIVAEKALLEKLAHHLEGELPLRFFKLQREDKKLLTNHPFLTRKQLVVALNLSEGQLQDDKRTSELDERYRDLQISFVDVPAEVELEIASLESAEDRSAFMKEMGIQKTALYMLSRVCIEALGLISFFTVLAGGELRQWFLRRGSTALDAAGAIHSDLQRGFIRTEVIKYKDLIQVGSEEKVKSEGKLYVKGRDYVVEDGDILYVRFNV